ncbi:microtubule-associated proteins 1A/1B light chain 3C-like [Pelobates fuscus]|uniref:microtubule-associated proteins 1A/1B light chain 3C-like n=1 Tax=Pelobates fuscus TaxID=191477 RepID=UPI002FE4AE60
MSPLGSSVSLDLNVVPFKMRKRLDSRIHEVNRMKSRYPSKIPVIVERNHREKLLPNLEKIKYLVPPEVTLGQFVSMIRTRLSMPQSHSLCMLLNGKQMTSLTLTMSELYTEYHDHDGFLYMTYMLQDVFG